MTNCFHPELKYYFNQKTGEMEAVCLYCGSRWSFRNQNNTALILQNWGQEKIKKQKNAIPNRQAC